jgi:UDP-N-acetyl-D-mannosaminuronic acid dehydrogenase
MFVNSSNTIKSKILQAAMEIDDEYREYFQNAKELNKSSELKDCEIIKALR